jgi:hypothetical protein
MINYRKLVFEEIEFLATKLRVPISRIHVHHIDHDRNNNCISNLFVCLDNFHYANFHPEFYDFKNDCFKSNWGQMAGWNKGLTKKTDDRIKPSWNKGLTKEDNEILAKTAKKISKSLKGYKKSIDSIQKQSETITGENNPRYLDYFVDELQFAIYDLGLDPNKHGNKMKICTIIGIKPSNIYKHFEPRGLTWNNIKL